MTGQVGALQMSFSEVSHCPSCGSDRFDPLFSIADTLTRDLYGARIAEEVINNLVRCASCQLVRLAPRLSDESLQVVYSDWYSAGYGVSQAGQDEDSARAEEFEVAHMGRMSRVARPPGALLDVGTGSGLFLRVARKAGWDASGVDLSADAAALAWQHHGIVVHVGTLSDLPEAPHYDVITMFDYLEHTTTPARDLEAACKRLKPGGHIVIRVPNFGGWQARVMGAAWVGVISLHLSYFEVETLSSLLDRQGLTIVHRDSGNYQSLAQLLGKKLSWMRHRVATGAMNQALASAGPAQPIGRLRRLQRFAMASLYEVVDHVGGWFGSSNYIFLVARKK
jgi:2-polyprenyl-3-methyl-5-hydroxy-6-metoxy-1,4-benzoquinol methylase